MKSVIFDRLLLAATIVLLIILLAAIFFPMADSIENSNSFPLNQTEMFLAIDLGYLTNREGSVIQHTSEPSSAQAIFENQNLRPSVKTDGRLALA
jgi:hypothetical protein